jgi:UDP-N-acetylglucosamine 2-epimerase (non-hydrolysing)
VISGTVQLVGTNEDRILSLAIRLENRSAYEAMARIHNPYSDAHASARISGLIDSFLK